MSKNQNVGKTKRWRGEEARKANIAATKEGHENNSLSVHQKLTNQGRREKGHIINYGSYMSPLLRSMMRRIGLINKNLPQV